MRALFATQPQLGHFHNLLPLARELRELGVEVSFATGSGFGRYVSAQGYTHRACGWDHDGVGDLLDEVARSGVGSISRSKVSYFVDPLAECYLQDFEQIVDQWHPNLVVRDPVEFGSAILCEKAGIKCITMNWGYNFPFRGSFGKFSNELNRLRLRYGLPADGSGVSLNGLFSVNCLPESWYTEQPWKEYRVRYYNGDVIDAYPERMAPSLGGNGSTLIYATLGTVFVRDDMLELYRQVFRAIPEFQFVLTNPNQIEEDYSEHNVLYSHYIPNTQIIPRCHLVLCHGGYNTLRGALRHGIPVVLTPIAGDQIVYAQRCEELGLGVSVPRDGITANRVKSAVIEVLTNPKYRSNARRYAKNIAALPSLGDLAAELADMTSTG